MALNYKPNTIKTDFGSYRHYWRGIKKIGKTTMFRDIVLEQYGDLKHGLLISLGTETGYKAIGGLYVHDATTWKEFVETVTDLVKSKKENEFKVVAFDTVDELVQIAVDEAMEEHYRVKKFQGKSINEILGGFGAGRSYVRDLIDTQIFRLERAGYGLVFIGHTKVKDIKEKGAEETYQILTGNLEHSFDGIFADKADIIATFYTDRTVSQGKVQSAKRYIYFRDDTFVDCGTRFENMPEKVEMTAKEYLRAFDIGVRSSLGFVSDEELLNLREKEENKRQEDGEKYSETEDLEKKELFDLETFKSAMIDQIGKLGGKNNAPLMVLIKSYEPSLNVNRITDVEKLKELQTKIDELGE